MPARDLYHGGCMTPLDNNCVNLTDIGTPVARPNVEIHDG
jgi:hypothetical protein